MYCFMITMPMFLAGKGGPGKVAGNLRIGEPSGKGSVHFFAETSFEQGLAAIKQASDLS